LQLGLCVREISSDHHPDSPEERLRIEASGGFVTTTGSLARVNGMLAVSRSIGDAELKKFGVIADPEMSGWFPITEQDKFLVLASDGIFDKLTPQEVCNVIHGLASNRDIQEVMEDFLKQDGSVGVMSLPLPASTDHRGSKDLNAIQSQTVELISDDCSVDMMNACHVGMNASTSLEVWNADKANAMFSKDAEVSCGTPYVDTDVCYGDDAGSTSMEPWYVGSAFPLHRGTSVARLMAQVLTELAYQAGCIDNLSVLVVPLRYVSNR
jgi:protein phosphatase 1K